MGLYDHSRYVEVTIHFRCNLRCHHCMIEDTMDRLQPESLDRYREILAHNRDSGRWIGMILTGAEVTLRRDLPEIAREARQHGFSHVRIQTHGMRLADRAYCDTLVAAGIDEYFVSITAADEATHDRITKVPGSFARTMQGLENLDQIEGVSILTNTVVTRDSYRQLPAIVERLASLRHLVQMDFWNYFPMTESDDKQLLVSHLEVAPYLREAIRQAEALGRAVEVKNFPECLLQSEQHALCNAQPMLYIDPDFWREFERNGFYQCVHRDQCQSAQCLGLNTAYIEKFGWHEAELRPLILSEVLSVRHEEVIR